jgi:hypothetical protein
MRLSEWRAAAPSKDAVATKVIAVVDPVLASLGVDPDPECWVAWGEEPAQRHTILAPMAAGLVACYVRVSVPGEGARAAAKLIRWNRVQLGELAIETQGGHRLLSFQVEGHVLRGADGEADRIAAFSLDLFAAVDGRPMPVRRPAAGRRAGRAAGGAGAAGGEAARTKPASGSSTQSVSAPKRKPSSSRRVRGGPS